LLHALVYMSLLSASPPLSPITGGDCKCYFVHTRTEWFTKRCCSIFSK